MRLVIQSIRNDFGSRNPVHITLALQCIANIGNREMAEAFGRDIPKMLVSGLDVLSLHVSVCYRKILRAVTFALKYLLGLFVICFVFRFCF